METGDQERTGENETITNNRMKFIRVFESTEQRDQCGEYEFASEVRIFGQLNYSNNDLIMRFITAEPDRDGLLKYTLSISSPAQYKLAKYQTSKEGYYFYGGIGDEIISLASLYLRCRFFPTSYIYRGLTGPAMMKTEYDFKYIKPQKNADRFLFNQEERNFVKFGEFLNKIKILQEDLHHNFANAVRLYATAIREIGSNDEIAYIHLVSCIELLSKNYPLSHQQDPLLPAMEDIKKLLDNSSAQAKNELSNLFEQRKSIMKFISFIENNYGDTIPGRPQTGAIENKIYKDSLPNVLKRIYKARSKFLHEGSLMYISAPGITADNCDFDFTLGGTIDNRELLPEEKLPNISFFEGLVRNCLLNYLEEKISS